MTSSFAKMAPLALAAALGLLSLGAQAETRYEWRRVVSGLKKVPSAQESAAAGGTGVKLQAGGYRTWADGSVASSCKNYLSPGSGKAYTGDTGDGLYQVQPPGQALAVVHCDMSTDGGGWTLVVRIMGGSNVHARATAEGTLSSPTQLTPAKLSDAYINALMDPLTGQLRLSTTQGAPTYTMYATTSGVPFSASGMAASRPLSASLEGPYMPAQLNGMHGGINGYQSGLPFTMVYGPSNPDDTCRVGLTQPVAPWCGPGGSGLLYVR